MTLYELIVTSGEGLDVCDKVWDWGTYFDFSTENDSLDEDVDWYDECMAEIAKRTNVIKVNRDWYSTCDFNQMILDNISAFKQFFNEENREGYRPDDYENSDDSSTDEGFYEAYMSGLESLIVGNYTDDDYRKLTLLLRK